MNEPIKLSEAIRQGAQLHPQGFGYYVIQVDSVFHTCALGAAIEHTTGKVTTNRGDNERAVRHLLEEREIDYHTPLYNPITEQREPFIQCIAHMNDVHRMKREAIADSLEDQGY